MSWIADQFGFLFSVNDRAEEIELQRQRIFELERKSSGQTLRINGLNVRNLKLIEQNLRLTDQIKKLKTDCRMALNAMQHALGEQESQITEEPGHEQRPDEPQQRDEPE